MDLADNPFEETEQKPADLPLMAEVSPLNSNDQPQAVASGQETGALPEVHRLAVAGQPYRITAANARILQQKSLEARRLKHLAAQPIPQPEPVAVDKIGLRVQKVDERIDSILQEMADSDSPRDTQALAMALDRLCGVWSLLTGHPRPGVRKTDTKRGRPNFATPSE